MLNGQNWHMFTTPFLLISLINLLEMRYRAGRGGRAIWPKHFPGKTRVDHGSKHDVKLRRKTVKGRQVSQPLLLTPS